MRNRVILASAAAVAAPLAAMAFGATAAHAATAPTGASAVTNLTDRLDSGYSGDNWASDTITRTASIALVAPDTTPGDCGITPSIVRRAKISHAPVPVCYTYKGTIKDTGIAAATEGAVSPGSSATAITGSPTASIQGTDYIQFHSSSDAPDATLVPKTMSGNAEATTDWVEQFFPEGTTFGTGPVETTYSWTYADTKDCQTWIDASDVSKADSGDITGVDSCSTTIPDVAPQTVTVGQAYSFQVPATTTSSDTSLTYSVKGLPDGLGINSATGKITGTPVTDAVGGTATVTATDFGGVTASTEIDFTVNPAVTPPAVAVLSAGHAVPTSVGATVTWKCSVAGATFHLTLNGPGKEDGKTATVSVAKAVYGGLESGHSYSVTIQAYVGGKPSGHSGIVEFKTLASK